MPIESPVYEDGGYYYEGNVEVGIWAKRSAGWQLVATQFHSISKGPYDSGGQSTFNFSADDLNVNLGSDVQAVGITIQSSQAVSSSLTGFTKLAWQAQGSSGGEYSATPNGETTTVTVTP